VSQDILEEALAITKGRRNEDYGPPTKDFERTAVMWSAILGCPVSAEQIALCMIALKISRACQSPAVRDHWVDMAGYARCGHLCAEHNKQKEIKT
jgi:hypothetical protein